VATKKESTKSSKSNSSSEGKVSVPKTSSKEPSTMEELMTMYGGGFKHFNLKDRVPGKITYIDNKKVLLDIGGKTEGLVTEKAFKLAEDYIKTLKVGDTVEGVVLVSETRDGYTILSLKQAAEKLAWVKIEKLFEDGTPVKVEAKAVNAAGVLVELDGITGFIPTSQLGRNIDRKPENLVGHKFEAKIIDFDKEVNKIVLSEKEVSEAEELGKYRDAMKDIKDGEEFDGVVSSVFDFGAFVKFDANKAELEGLVHISELSWDKVQNASDVIKVGDKVKVKVVGKRNDKLALSIKQTLKDPWTEADKKYPKDTKAEGKVVRISDFGMFVSVEPGVEGLVHITKIPPTQKYEVGDDVNVTVEEIDSKAKKMSLGLVLSVKPIGYK
jgi:small subunit ribosomal protein S1